MFFQLCGQAKTEESLPSRERGLKYKASKGEGSYPIVAPFVGAWIEINQWFECIHLMEVAPFTGAWIEIFEKCS